VKNFLIRVLLFIVAAELIASLAVWHGTPTDWRGRPLSFWYFEMLRLRYWIGFGLAFAVFCEPGDRREPGDGTGGQTGRFLMVGTGGQTGRFLMVCGNGASGSYRRS
jgi:hypothetical protein